MEDADINTEIVIFDDSFFNSQEQEHSFKPIYVEDLNEVALLAFSSGSTGLSKGICLNHYSALCENLMEEEELWKKHETMVLLSYDSFYWTAETIRFVSALRQGACRLVSSRNFDESTVWHIIEKYRVNVAYLIPYDMIRMYDFGKPENINLDSLTTIVSEGAPIAKKYQLAFQELLPNVDIFQIYGMTEAGVLTRFYKDGPLKKYNRKKMGSAGHLALGKGISYKIVDLASGRNMGPNEPGELRVKGKTFMTGYYKMDSSDQFDEDGWLRTGDVLYYDEDYYFYVLNRIKDVIICQGWHVTPASLEAVLVTHPAVKKAVVIGVPHDQDVERPLGVVVLDNNGGNVSATEIEDYFQRKAPDQPLIKVKIVESIPLTPSGKVKREELKEYILSSGV